MQVLVAIDFVIFCSFAKSFNQLDLLRQCVQSRGLQGIIS